jgi:hypothetical protein
MRYVIRYYFVTISIRFNWFQRARSGEEDHDDDKDPATVVSIALGLLGAEEDETVNKQQFIIG